MTAHFTDANAKMQCVLSHSGPSAEQDADRGHVVPGSGSQGLCCVTSKSSIWPIEGVTIIRTGSRFKKHTSAKQFK